MWLWQAVRDARQRGCVVVWAVYWLYGIRSWHWHTYIININLKYYLLTLLYIFIRKYVYARLCFVSISMVNARLYATLTSKWIQFHLIKRNLYSHKYNNNWIYIISIYLWKIFLIVVTRNGNARFIQPKICFNLIKF